MALRLLSNRSLSLSNAIRRISTDKYKIIVTEDETTLVAWHPKAQFPYECTKPLPEEKVDESNSPLQTQLTPELMNIFNKKTEEQKVEELMNITYTTKHRWFPRARDKRAKKTPMQREYL